MTDNPLSRRTRPRSITSQVKKLGFRMIDFGLWMFKYSVVPGALFVATNYTEPFPSLFELLVPPFAYLNF